MCVSENLRATYRKLWSRMKSRLMVKWCLVCVHLVFTQVLTDYPLYVVKPIENLSGHSINLYQIHGGKSVLLVKNEDQTKMEEGEYFAIETFGSTGRGRVVEDVRTSYFLVSVI